jgi:hypothetical protein
MMLRWAGSGGDIGGGREREREREERGGFRVWREEREGGMDGLMAGWLMGACLW